MKFTGARLMEIPSDIGFNGVQTEGAHFLKSVAPIFRHHAEIMHRARKNTEGFTIEQELGGRSCKCHRIRE